jgi:hypothetical protein
MTGKLVTSSDRVALATCHVTSFPPIEGAARRLAHGLALSPGSAATCIPGLRNLFRNVPLSRFIANVLCCEGQAQMNI